VIAVGALVFWWRQPAPLPVTVAEVGRGDVEAIVANTRAGSIEACQRARLSTITGGRIETLTVKEGDKVKQGQLLMQLWNEDQQAQATLAAAQRTVAQQRVGEACSLADNAQREAQRTAQLKAAGFVSASREDTARAEAKARAAACATARADVVQADARWRASRVEQGRTKLVAPFDGTVAKIVGELGEYSTPSPPGVATQPAIDLIDDSCLYVKAPMDEVDAPRLHPTQRARITLDALPGKSFAATVSRVAPVVSAVEKQARTVDIDVRFDDPAATAGLRVGYSADVEVVLDTRTDVLRVPTAALMEGNRVLVFNAGEGRLTARKVETGIANWQFTEIVSGLTAGERIVTSLERDGARDGARVTVDRR
jgi:HlyD family secretion protein